MGCFSAIKLRIFISLVPTVSVGMHTTTRQAKKLHSEIIIVCIPKLELGDERKIYIEIKDGRGLVTMMRVAKRSESLSPDLG